MFCLSAHAQDAPADSLQAADESLPEKLIGLAEDVIDLVTWSGKKWSFAVFPTASYSVRTGLGIGMMPALQLHKADRPPTTITPSFQVTTKGMFEVQFDIESYSRSGLKNIGKTEFYYLPDRFYGIGNEEKDSAVAEYDIYHFMVSNDATRSIGESGLLLGVSCDFSYHSFSHITPCDSLSFSQIDNGSRWSNGIGMVMEFDSRDNTLSPLSGWYVRLSAMGYAKFLGSKHRFGVFTANARKYLNLTQESVLAMQCYMSASVGDAPFHKLSTCGGTRLGRAIPHNYKYVDKYAWLVQSEYRFPVYWRIGATAFVGAGNVSATFNDKMFDNCHLMAGGGLRFQVFPSSGLKIRLDAGVSNRGDKAVYFNIKEAF